MTETNECLICSLCDPINDLIEYPNKNVYCECKFHIHKSCLEAIKEKWANKCPLCFKEYETIEINITDENNITPSENEENEENGNKKCGKIVASFFFFSIQFVVIGLLVHYG